MNTKRMMLIFGMAAIVLFTAMPSMAGVVGTARAKVPFAFEVGDRLMPAGEYRFERNMMGYSVQISDMNGNTASVLTFATGNPSSPREAGLRFEKIGDTYRLAEVHLGGGTGNGIAPTKRQSEMAKNRQDKKMIDVAIANE